MNTEQLIAFALQFAIAIPAIVFHEVAHGYVAYYLGDPTAKSQGRLSLNPLKHIDPFGTLLLPILLIQAFGAGFGYAKPVPVNPMYFKDRRKGMFLTGIAGPATNLTLAAVSGGLVRLLDLVLASGAVSGVAGVALGYLWLALYYFVVINLVLVFFNLLPIPPLDGSRVLPLFLSDRAMHTYRQFERYGFIIVFVLILVAPRLLGFSPISAYFSVTVYPLVRLFTGVG